MERWVVRCSNRLFLRWPAGQRHGYDDSIDRATRYASYAAARAAARAAGESYFEVYLLPRDGADYSLVN